MLSDIDKEKYVPFDDYFDKISEVVNKEDNKYHLFGSAVDKKLIEDAEL